MFRPRGTARCVGKAAFRTQLARDLGCLLDLDDEVEAWSCLPAVLGHGEDAHVPDFLVQRSGRRHALVDAGAAPGRPSLKAEAEERGYSYESWSAERIREGFRLRNAKDLLRYANWECPLGDRIRLLAGLDEAGSLTVAECLPAFAETRPMAGLAALVLHRFVFIDLDAALIGPETAVRRWRRE
jgi:hypothetical protein